MAINRIFKNKLSHIIKHKGNLLFKRSEVNFLPKEEEVKELP